MWIKNDFTTGVKLLFDIIITEKNETVVILMEEFTNTFFIEDCRQNLEIGPNDILNIFPRVKVLSSRLVFSSRRWWKLLDFKFGLYARWSNTSHKNCGRWCWAINSICHKMTLSPFSRAEEWSGRTALTSLEKFPKRRGDIFSRRWRQRSMKRALEN